MEARLQSTTELYELTPPVPLLYPSCTPTVPLLYPSCTLPVPFLYPYCTFLYAFLASLAVADFLVGVGIVPSFFFCEIARGGCKWSRAWSTWLPGLIRWLFGYASVFNLCSLVTDRYIAIVKPLKYVTCV